MSPPIASDDSKSHDFNAFDVGGWGSRFSPQIRPLPVQQQRDDEQAQQPDAQFGRILAAYGGVFVAGSLLWGMEFDGYRPDRWDVTGALICLAGVGVIMYAPGGA